MDKLQLITDFINFAKSHLDLNELDAVYTANQLYEEFGVYPSDKEYIAKVHDVNYFVDQFNKAFNNDQIKIAHIFDLVSPRPHQIVRKFYALKKRNPKLATSYLYNLGINNYYIHKKDIDKNLEWKAAYKSGQSLEITINLSKPEKNNKDIAKLLTVTKEVNYPKCVICEENLGFYGNAKKAPRQNIRIIPMKLNNEDWFMQYSPYGYFKEHMILVSKKHTPMEISERIFRVMFAFLKEIPHYTITSNSDLPIVGGSILNHEHFQGGNYSFPIQKAHDLFVIKHKKYKNVKISYLNFYNSAIKLVSKKSEEIIKCASDILKHWRSYKDETLAIAPKHNTITPLIKINNKKEYEMILILRCNSTNKKYPDGIYHVHPEYFPIKQEGIGVIEACGRFILPARLKRQINEVNAYVKNGTKFEDQPKFKHMIDTMKKEKISAKEYVNEVGRNILNNTSVFKKDKDGEKHRDCFIKSLGL